MQKSTSIAMSFIFSTCMGGATAQSAEEAFIKESLLSVSAFQCAIVATDPDQNERLFNVGLKSGRSFFETAKSKPDPYAKARRKVPMLLTLIGGPTTDFFLGQLYAQLEADVYKKFESDDMLWKQIKDNMFGEKNCALLQ